MEVTWVIGSLTHLCQTHALVGFTLTYPSRLFGPTQTRAPVSLVSLELETGSKHQLRIHLSKVLNGERPRFFLLQNYTRRMNA